MRSLRWGAIAIVVCVAPAWGQSFEGPNILSRGGRSLGRSGGRQVRFTGFAAVGVSYYDGLSLAKRSDQGGVPDESAYGGSASFGLSGSRADRRSTTSGGYSGSMVLFNSQSNYSGLNQQASINHARQLSRRWSMFTGVSAGSFATVLGLNRTPFSQSYFEQPVAAGTEVFDTRIYQFSGGAGLSYQKSARLTFSMSGGGSTQRFNSTALVGYQGFFSSGEVSYALSRRTGIGGVYTFGTSYFRRGYGESLFHTAGFTFQRRLSRIWSTGGSLGFYRAETDRLQQQAIDPLIAALTGQTTAVFAHHAVNYGRAISLGLGGTFRTSSVHIGYTGGLSPGNGIYLTSDSHNAGVQYNYTGFRRVGFSASADYTKFRPLLPGFEGQRNFEAYGGGAGISYRLFSVVHLAFNAAIRRSQFDSNSNFSRDRYYLGASLAFSPGELPLLPW